MFTQIENWRGCCICGKTNIFRRFRPRMTKFRVSLTCSDCGGLLESELVPEFMPGYVTVWDEREIKIFRNRLRFLFGEK